MKYGGLESVNDRTRRLCYTGGTPFMAIDAKKSGLSCNPITGGTLHQLVAKRQYYTGAYDPFKKSYPRLFNWEMPGDFAKVLSRQFEQSTDMGYRNLPMLTALPYELRTDANGNEIYHDDAYAYFDVVHPRQTSCPYGLNTLVQFTDPQAGQSTPGYQHCPTCQLKDLTSQACLNRISDAVALNPSVFNESTLLELRDALIEANRASLAFVARSIEAVTAEINSRRAGSPQGRTHFNTIDLIHFKMQHKEAPRDEQSTLITQLVQGLTANQTPTAPVAATPAIDADTLAQLKEFTEWKASQDAKKAADTERMAKVRAGRSKVTEGDGEPPLAA